MWPGEAEAVVRYEPSAPLVRPWPSRARGAVDRGSLERVVDADHGGAGRTRHNG